MSATSERSPGGSTGVGTTDVVPGSPELAALFDS